MKFQLEIKKIHGKKLIFFKDLLFSYERKKYLKLFFKFILKYIKCNLYLLYFKLRERGRRRKTLLYLKQITE